MHEILLLKIIKVDQKISSFKICTNYIPNCAGMSTTPTLVYTQQDTKDIDIYYAKLF